MILVRAAIATSVLLAAAAAIGRTSTPEPITTGGRLQDLLFTVASWSGRPAASFDDSIVRVLGVDEYIHRVYVDQLSRRPVWLYVGFHASQAEGDSIHSPMNCLPGAGWQPIERNLVRLSVADSQGVARQVDVNELVIEKGIDHQVVVYWYQNHGRVVASEYWSKAFTVLDAIRWNRSDAAFVRLIAPMTGDRAATSGLVQKLASDLFPAISGALPQ